MKKSLLTLVSLITSSALGTSIYLATLEQPTEIQQQLSITTNAIAVAGTSTLFGLLDDDKDDSSAA